MQDGNKDAPDQHGGQQGIDKDLLELQHVCRTILRLSKDSNLKTCLCQLGYQSIHDVLATPDHVLQELSVGTTWNNRIQILPGMMAMILMLRHYQIHCADQDQHIRDWTQVTHKDFTGFRQSYNLPRHSVRT